VTRTQRAKNAFFAALLLLCVSGIAAGFVIDRLVRAEAQVQHSYDVEVAIGDFESSLTVVGQSRVAYINSPSPEALQHFEGAVQDVGTVLARVRQMTHNANQQALCDQLQAAADRRIALSRESVDVVRQNRSDPEKQSQLTFAVAQSTFETTAISQQMRRNEDQLLQQRNQLSKQLLGGMIVVLAVSFLSSALMFDFYYRLLNREVIERGNAENQLRRLSVQLMRAQDEERRRFARELHDGVGQNLVAAKMLVDTVIMKNESDVAVELSKVLEETIAQIRATSYLYHPPLLDEVGFNSAARWLVEGWAQRLGFSISADFSRPIERLPPAVEVALYRVLQEGLNNIYRHAQSAKAEVSLRADSGSATLRVKDYGRGIPGEILVALQAGGPQAGVGLTGMKERVRELGGQLEIHSDGNGTEIVAKIPFSGAEVEPLLASAEPLLRAG
jgi:signal transduction histidine kinase